MSRRLAPVVTGFLLISLFIAGCGALSENNGGDVNGVDPDLTLEQAKQTAMDMELELAAMIPSENVVSIDQSQMGVLMSCDDQRGYQWAGGTNVVLNRTLDAATLVDTVVSEYSNRDPYAARSIPTYDGEPRAQVAGPNGAGYLLRESPDKTVIEISSFSPCFVLPDDMSPLGEY